MVQRRLPLALWEGVRLRWPAAKIGKVLVEESAVRMALRRASPGDLVVVGADDAVNVYPEAMALAGRDEGGTAFADPGEVDGPRG